MCFKSEKNCYFAQGLLVLRMHWSEISTHLSLIRIWSHLQLHVQTLYIIQANRPQRCMFFLEEQVRESVQTLAQVFEEHISLTKASLLFPLHSRHPDPHLIKPSCCNGG